MIALFLILLAAAYLLYFSGKQMAAFLIFFFFLLKALQLIPEAWMGLKGLDFALLFVLPLFVWGCIREEEFIPRGRLTFFIFLFLAFILGECLLSRFYYGIDWISIFRTGRQSLLLLAYFLFRRLSKEEVTLISKILLAVLSVQCVLFMLQTITGIGLLAEHENNYSNGLFYRFYNVPILLYILVYYAVFANPFHGIWRVITTALPVLTIFAPMHRSLMAIFIMLLLIGILWIRGYLQSVRNILVASVTVFVLVVGALYYMSSRAVSDIERVTSGEFVDVEEVDLSDESTLLFRAAHFFERYQETTETAVGTLFGLGFMSENTHYTENHFNFIIGLEDNETGATTQLDTSDIAWSIFIIRYGIVGTLIYLALYAYVGVRYWRRRGTLAISMVLSLALVFGFSFTSDQLFYTTALIFPLLHDENSTH